MKLIGDLEREREHERGKHEGLSLRALTGDVDVFGRVGMVVCGFEEMMCSGRLLGI